MFFTPWNPNKWHKLPDLPAGPPAPILKMHPVPGGCSMSILGHDGKRYYQDGAPGQMMKGDGCLVMLLLFCVKPVAILILLFGLSRSKPEKR